MIKFLGNIVSKMKITDEEKKLRKQIETKIKDVKFEKGYEGNISIFEKYTYYITGQSENPKRPFLKMELKAFVDDSGFMKECDYSGEVIIDKKTIGLTPRLARHFYNEAGRRAVYIGRRNMNGK